MDSSDQGLAVPNGIGLTEFMGTMLACNFFLLTVDGISKVLLHWIVEIGSGPPNLLSCASMIAQMIYLPLSPEDRLPRLWLRRCSMSSSNVGSKVIMVRSSVLHYSKLVVHLTILNM